ncbi:MULTISPECIES: glycosyltransferase [Burkholderiaceae]|uniref:glycosyltransferase family 2 protein n=1 Tax=Burkholderiaceae TaxID=119060 RepID=UPI000966C3CB|nr:MULTISPECIES: glycosyltransferase [Burkholderiaceae]MCG1039962.1 glycosyltransferase [Mycetohabitans sp. B7]SIT71917.1 Glycosyltransferase involved in cell wall bisynthesis [Burkholderia sp. b14]
MSRTGQCDANRFLTPDMTLSGRVSTSTLLTVVVPVYNLEDCIANALQSILKQRHLDEITTLVIDDGSTDRSRERIDAIVRANPHADIRVITQPNGGCSAARNTGIAQAQSPYLSFLDGDDTWEPDFSDKIIPILRIGRADVIDYNIWIVGRNGKQSDELTMIGAKWAGEHQVDDRLLLDVAATYEMFAWARIYRRSLWHGIAFPPAQLYEDAAVTPHLYLRARTVHRLSERLYNYHRRSGSITQVINMRSVQDLAKNVERALSQCADPAHRNYWMALTAMGFAHARREAARVDGHALGDALRIIDTLAQHCRTVTQAYPELAKHASFDRYRGAMYRERAVFLAKRAIKRLIGRERRLGAPPTAGKKTSAAVPALQDEH